MIPIHCLSHSTASPKRWPTSPSVGPRGTCTPKATAVGPSPYLCFPLASAKKTSDFTSSLGCPTGKTYGCMINWQHGSSADRVPVGECSPYLTDVQYLPKAQRREAIFKKDFIKDVHTHTLLDQSSSGVSAVCLTAPVQGFLL